MTYAIGDRVVAVNDWFVENGTEGVVVNTPYKHAYAPDDGYVYVDWDTDDPHLYSGFPMREEEIAHV